MGVTGDVPCLDELEDRVLFPARRRPREGGRGGESCAHSWHTRAERIPPAAFRYANALVEISLPNPALITTALLVGVLPLLGAVPFVYFPFIFLTALNLDSSLCVFAGAIAGAEIPCHVLNCDARVGNRTG